MSIRRKLPMFIGGLVTASLIVSGAINYYTSSNELVTESKQTLNTNAERTANVIGSLEQGEVQMTKTMANNDTVKDLVNMSNKANIKNDHTAASQRKLLSEVEKFLKESYEDTTDHDHFYVMDKNGNDIADSIPAYEKKNAKDRDYFQGAINGKVTVGKMDISKATGKPIIVIGIPIKNDAGEIIGVLADSIKPEFFTSNLNNIKVGKTGTVTLRDKDGLIISSKDKAKINTIEKRTDLNNLTKKVQIDDQEVNVLQRDLGTGDNKSLISMANVPGTDWIVGMEDSYADIKSPVKKMMMQTIWVILISIIISAMLGLYLSRMVTIPLSRLMNRMKEISEGNLNVSMNEPYKDEFKKLADSFNKMVDKTRKIIVHMNESIHVLETGSSELNRTAKTTAAAIDETTSTTQEISLAIESQARDTDEVANQITNLGVEIDEANKTVEMVKKHALEMSNLVESKKQVIQNLIQINKQNEIEVAKVSDSTQLLEESSARIGNITKVIHGIAEQTNLLALNASIEAARAGEAGRGFSVVAEEIRKLAEQSSHSVEQIHGIIREAQQFTKNNSESVKAIQSVTKEQNEYIVETKEAFMQVIDRVSDIIAFIRNIAEDMQEMNMSKDKVTSFVHNVSASGEEVSASIEEVAATSQEQSSMVQQLVEMVEKISNLADELEQTASIFKVE
ncbi:methyl-accepting chemotaxis protein [Heyndrickxia ginsengihumi]|uniref:methyl-accepting chemotaxis protein n=1 Tax=Heyndrickxia ginsengihumi TaxID=363870 RepID=UPI00046FC21C|nr:methyl-accepting chemotaxis protein [Heyndrickxia ginsengihumi]